MATAGRGGRGWGLARRQERSTARQQPQGNKWIPPTPPAQRLLQV